MHEEVDFWNSDPYVGMDLSDAVSPAIPIQLPQRLADQIGSLLTGHQNRLGRLVVHRLQLFDPLLQREDASLHIFDDSV